jgi:hypothetical protein
VVYRTLNYTLYRLVEVSKFRIRTTIFSTKASFVSPPFPKYLNTYSFYPNNSYDLKTTSILSSLLSTKTYDQMSSHLTPSSTPFEITSNLQFAYTPYLNKHEPYYSLDFYNAIHASFNEHINILTDILVS